MKRLIIPSIVVLAGWLAVAQVGPRLTISGSSNQTAVIQWPATNTGFVLLTAGTPAVTNWQASGYPSLFDATAQTFQVSVAAENPFGFYRLAPAPVAIELGTPQPIFSFGTPSAMGMFNVPDMHLAVLQQTNQTYLLWITGNIGTNGGSVAMLSTTDFLNYSNAGPGSATSAEAVFTPSWDGISTNEPSYTNIDSRYAGANSVITATNGHDLLMFYEAGTFAEGVEYNVMALARSTNLGLSWTREGAVISGHDGIPTNTPVTSQPGISEPGLIITNGFMYMFHQYIPDKPSDPSAPSVIQVSRAPVSGDGAPGTWTNYYNGAWKEPSLGGRGDSLVTANSTNGCTRPVEVWPAYNTYLNCYLLLFLANEGWFFSTSTNLVTWTEPVNFLPELMFQNCQPMDWNYIFVTPGYPAGVIGQTGYVLYAHTDQKGLGCTNTDGSPSFKPHELWVRSFNFHKQP